MPGLIDCLDAHAMSLPKHHLELLSPARDTTIAKEAILHGADAVYIGGPGFGARHNASNSVAEIAELVQFAHLFHARVFVTLNTILHEDELEPARQMIWQLYEAGIDALIAERFEPCWVRQTGAAAALGPNRTGSPGPAAASVLAHPGQGHFALAFPPNAWPLLRAEGTRGPNGLSLRVTAEAKDEARLRGALAALRAGLAAAGETVVSITLQAPGNA